MIIRLLTMSACPRIVCLLIGLGLVSFPLAAARAEEHLVKREILALYDGRFDALQYTHIHKLAEMPLNHLGYTLTYWDIERGLPDVRSIERYKGVLTWFGRTISKPDAYLPWAAEIVDRGLKLVILGDIGVPIEPRYMEGINAILGDIGLKHSGQFVEVPFSPQVIVKDPAVMEFERKLDPVMPGFPVLTAEAKDVVSHLTLASSRGATGRSSVLVATSPRGRRRRPPPLTSARSLIGNGVYIFQVLLGNHARPLPLFIGGLKLKEVRFADPSAA